VVLSHSAQQVVSELQMQSWRQWN